MEGQSAEVERKRTEDVDSGVSSFEEMLLPPHITSALYAAGFRRPSPVQHQAIPLARLGADLVVQVSYSSLSL